MHYCDHALSVVLPLLTFHIFDFSSETTEQNSTKLDKKQELMKICNRCGMPAGNAYPSGHLVLSFFGDLPILQLLRPVFLSLRCLLSIFPQYSLDFALIDSQYACTVRPVFKDHSREVTKVVT